MTIAVLFRDDTHYFVMTATKTSLLRRKVLKSDLSETQLLLSEDNIDRRHLLEYARDAAHWTTGLRHLEFALNANQSPDVALFDFTSVSISALLSTLTPSVAGLRRQKRVTCQEGARASATWRRGPQTRAHDVNRRFAFRALLAHRQWRGAGLPLRPRRRLLRPPVDAKSGQKRSHRRGGASGAHE